MLIVPSPQASTIDLLVSSIPNGGRINAAVIIGGKHAGAPSKICLRIMGMIFSACSGDTASAFVIMACTVRIELADERHRSLSDCSMILSVSLIPCFVLKRTKTRRNLFTMRVTCCIRVE